MEFFWFVVIGALTGLFAGFLYKGRTLSALANMVIGMAVSTTVGLVIRFSGYTAKQHLIWQLLAGALLVFMPLQIIAYLKSKTKRQKTILKKTVHKTPALSHNRSSVMNAKSQIV